MDGEIAELAYEASRVGVRLVAIAAVEVSGVVVDGIDDNETSGTAPAVIPTQVRPGDVSWKKTEVDDVLPFAQETRSLSTGHRPFARHWREPSDRIGEISRDRASVISVWSPGSCHEVEPIGQRIEWSNGKL